MNDGNSLSHRLTAKPLQPWSVGGFFFTALLLYSLPLAVNHPPASNNVDRFFLAMPWRDETTYVGHGLGFSVTIPEQSALALVTAIMVMACSMAILARHWFASPTYTQCAILLPLWYNPLYLQVMSTYQGALPVSIGIALSLLMVCHRHRVGLVYWWGLPTIVVAAVMSIHPLLLAVFFGVACVDVLQAAHRQPASRRVFELAMHHLKVGIGASLLYLVCTHLSAIPGQTGLGWPFLADGYRHLLFLAREASLHLSPLNAGVAIAVLAAAAAGWGLIARCARRGPYTPGALRLHIGLCLACIAGLCLCFGCPLLASSNAEGALEANAWLGSGPLLVALLYLAYVFLIQMKHAYALLISVPLMCLLTFAFGYGR
ncbi:hypothetical protein [Pseudomonas sp. RIT-PI-S]|uniref:hypothetical protein n=1 Tax=Pseudomonas sp. RIT-PI-S TaxID=3035295 RepID=UPI0021D8E23F|nr:hypothetical protein [Pseudomonas sp. RIT-PI-S]